MKLDFRMLQLDDNPNSIESALLILDDYLKARGFDLSIEAPKDLSGKAIKRLAQRKGKEFDLVIIDFNLGLDNVTGADLASNLRYQLPYTDIIFYSSDTTAKLLQQLADKQVAGVFVADRPTLPAALTGIADTIIGKAVDLDHMRGVAMAEVAEIDVLMEESLVAIFSSSMPGYVEAAKETLEDLIEKTRMQAARTEHLCGAGSIIDIVADGRVFSSALKYHAIRRVAKRLPIKPVDALKALESYETDVIGNRNLLAHAKADLTGDIQTLRSPRKDREPLVIDDAWMSSFRTKLKSHRDAIAVVCNALETDIAQETDKT